MNRREKIIAVTIAVFVAGSMLYGIVSKFLLTPAAELKSLAAVMRVRLLRLPFPATQLPTLPRLSGQLLQRVTER